MDIDTSASPDLLTVKKKEMNTTNELTQEEKDDKIKVLYIQKTALLDKYGVFGGGREVNQLHEYINRQLEALGVKP